MFGKRNKMLQLLRLVPYVERNYNLIELGPKGTGKKTKGYMDTDPNVRKGIAMGLKSMKKKGFIGIKAKKIPKDLSHLKGYLD